MTIRDQQRSRQRAARREKHRNQQSAQQQRSNAASSAVGRSVTRDNLGQAMTVAVALHHARRFDEAERIYRKVLAIAPEHIDAQSSLAMIDFQAQRHDVAIERLERVIAVVADNPGYHMNLAAAYDAAGHPAQAEAGYARAIALAPTYADPYYNLGDLYLRLGRPDAALRVFDDCMAAIGREFHALAYKAHALDDAGRHEEARHLLNFDEYVATYRFEPPKGYDGLTDFNAAFAKYITNHPTLQANVMSTVHGKHTGELLSDPKGPMAELEPRIQQAILAYIDRLPDDPEHPAVKWAPKAWKLTSWGVVMFDRGHERAHIHPKGWLSGVFYVHLPDLIDDPERNHEGWLEFGRPTADLHVQSAPTLRHYQPAYGQMFLFPSFFYHGTIPFRSDQRRICVAFDVEPRY